MRQFGCKKLSSKNEVFTWFLLIFGKILSKIVKNCSLGVTLPIEPKNKKTDKIIEKEKEIIKIIKDNIIRICFINTNTLITLPFFVYSRVTLNIITHYYAVPAVLELS